MQRQLEQLPKQVVPVAQTPVEALRRCGIHLAELALQRIDALGLLPRLRGLHRQRELPYQRALGGILRR